ncbi:2-dehydropantoate 2-reductase [Zavarzinia compransoris]|uniref:2-dehydropantoate 2-reductase n=1 Tax=Zavarzinia compransoris TaxID=1264899 RepID=A0A317E0B2_9PROT|nr:2-dehydropantoate 2-reductase [Zavarzinia compransoris]PWR19874.1 2-dehydropantoate 2-reductase [Zavarzinia compransoris]TDP45014.1 ketopantoate reductase [Zavarzinia compransoris]
MKIAVIGAGGVGGYFGARLAQAGHDVAFVARGAHLAALQKNGLAVEGAAGSFLLPAVHATRDPASIGPADIVVFAVKMYDVAAAAALIGPLLGPDTLVLTLQNGVDAPHLLTRNLGARRVLGGAAYISAVIAAPGVIRVSVPSTRIEFAPVDGAVSPLAAEFADAGRAAGFGTVLGDDVDVVLWRKFCMLAAFSGVTAMLRSAIGPIREHAVARALLGDAVAEAVAVGRARGVALPDDMAATILRLLDAVPALMKSSMLEDLERHRPLEVEDLSGAIVRLGAELGVATPVHRAILGALVLHAAGVPG